MARSERDWTGLQAAVGDRVVLSDDPRYDGVRRPALARYADVRPQSVVLAEHESDVVEAVGFSRRAGLRATPRSGGHCFAGRSSSGDVIVDLRRMDDVRVTPGLVEVAAGVRLGRLEAALATQGSALPLGCGASVGVAGLALGGGLGLLGRRYGLTCDSLVRARVVLGDGQIVECDASRDADLLWALRGAGGGRFGVVTRLWFRTVPSPTMTAFQLRWRADHAAAVLAAWLRWAPYAPDAATAELRLSDGAQHGGLAVEVYGAVLAEPVAAVRLLEDLIRDAGVPPAARSVRTGAYPAAKQALHRMRRASRPENPYWWEYSRSEFFRRGLPATAIDGLVDALTADLEQPPATRSVTFTPWAGAYSRVAREETAFAHRDALFLVEHVARTAPEAGPDRVSAARAWLARSYAALRPWGTGGVYPNFPDPDLEDEDRAYHGRNLTRLRQVEQAYQPDVFHWSVENSQPHSSTIELNKEER